MLPNEVDTARGVVDARFLAITVEEPGPKLFPALL